MASSSYTHQQSTAPASWTPVLNRLPSRPFSTADHQEVDRVPNALQSRPFFDPLTQQAGMPEVQTRQDEQERQRISEWLDLTKIDLFAGSRHASTVPPTPSLQRSESVNGPDAEVQEGQEVLGEDTLQRQGAAHAVAGGTDDESTIQAREAIGQPKDQRRGTVQRWPVATKQISGPARARLQRKRSPAYRDETRKLTQGFSSRTTQLAGLPAKVGKRAHVNTGAKSRPGTESPVSTEQMAATPQPEQAVPPEQQTDNIAPNSTASEQAVAQVATVEGAAAQGPAVQPVEVLTPNSDNSTTPPVQKDEAPSAEAAPQTAASPQSTEQSAETAIPAPEKQASGPAPASVPASPAASGGGEPAMSGSGGTGGEVSGGGGGGSAIADPETSASAPDVSQADPASAIASVSGLPPAQLLSALGGVTTAVTNNIGKQKAELAANPPQSDTLPSVQKPTGETMAPIGELPKPVEKPAAGEEKPVPDPDSLPLEQAPLNVITPPPAVQGNEEGTLSDADVSNMKASLSQLPSRDPGIDAISAGSPPKLTLAGNADPQKTQEQRTQLEASLTDAQTKSQQELAQPVGTENIQPTVPQKNLKAQIAVGGGAMAGATATGAAMAVGGGSSDGSGDGFGDAASIFAQQEKGGEIQAAAAQAQGDLAAKKQDHAAKVAEEQSLAKQGIEQLKQENVEQQNQERSKAQADVAGLQGEWSKEQEDLVGQSRKDADQLVSEGLQEVEAKQAEGDAIAAQEIQKGEADAEAERQKGEAKAASEKEKGQTESSGFFGWVANKAKTFFDGIKNGIKQAFEAARTAMRKAIEAAKKLATAAIEKARQAIVGVIRRVGDALVALGDTLLAKWPGLRDKWRGAIEKRVKQAEEAVNQLAETLNEGMQKALDTLGGALDAALGLLEKGMLAVVSVYEGVVMGAIKFGEGIAKSLGAFAVLAKDIAANPGQWISNLGAAVADGIQNHLWGAFQEQVKTWFNQKLEAVLGLGMMVWKLLAEGGIQMAAVGKMAWNAVQQALPTIIIGVLLERLVSMLVPAAGAVLAIIQGLQAAWGTVGQIIQAFGRFVEFLKAIKTGAAGPQFGALLASAAIVLLDFITNFIIAKIAKAARKVASKLKGLAKSLKRRFSRKKGKKKKDNKDKDRKDKSDQDTEKETIAEKQKRVDRAVSEATTAVNSTFGGKDASQGELFPLLQPIKLRHRLQTLKAVKKGNKWGVYGKVNPDSEEITAAQIDENLDAVREKMRQDDEDSPVRKVKEDGQVESDEAYEKRLNEAKERLETKENLTDEDLERYDILDKRVERNERRVKESEANLAEADPELDLAQLPTLKGGKKVSKSKLSEIPDDELRELQDKLVRRDPKKAELFSDELEKRRKRTEDFDPAKERWESREKDGRKTRSPKTDDKSLIRNTLLDGDDHLYVEDEEQAARIFHTLEEMADDGSVIGTDPRPEERGKLAFHGPEEHKTGHAPRDRHYNANITFNKKPRNIHIYFGSKRR